MFQDEKTKKRNKVKYRIVRKKNQPYVELSMDDGPTVCLRYSHNRIHLGRETWANYYVERYVDGTLERGTTIDDYFEGMRQGWVDQAARMEAKRVAEETAREEARKAREEGFVFWRREEDPADRDTDVRFARSYRSLCDALANGPAPGERKKADASYPGYPTFEERGGDFSVRGLNFNVENDALDVSSSDSASYETTGDFLGGRGNTARLFNMVYRRLGSIMSKYVNDELGESILDSREYFIQGGSLLLEDSFGDTQSTDLEPILLREFDVSTDDSRGGAKVAMIAFVDPLVDSKVVYQIKEVGIDDDGDCSLKAGVFYERKGDEEEQFGHFVVYEYQE